MCKGCVYTCRIVPGKKKTLFFLGILVGLFVMADTIKSEAPETVAFLQQMRIKVYLLTGDNQHTAQAIARQVVITV